MRWLKYLYIFNACLYMTMLATAKGGIIFPLSFSLIWFTLFAITLEKELNDLRRGEPAWRRERPLNTDYEV